MGGGGSRRFSGVGSVRLRPRRSLVVNEIPLLSSFLHLLDDANVNAVEGIRSTRPFGSLGCGV